MAATTRVKVKRETLIAKLQEGRAQIVASHMKRVEEFEAKRSKFLVDLEDAIEVFVEEVANDPDRAFKRCEGRYAKGGTHITLPKPTFPQPPEDEPKTRDIDRMLRVLEVSSDETISIAADDQYARYL